MIRISSQMCLPLRQFQLLSSLPGISEGHSFLRTLSYACGRMIVNLFSLVIVNQLPLSVTIRHRLNGINRGIVAEVSGTHNSNYFAKQNDKFVQSIIRRLLIFLQFSSPNLTKREREYLHYSYCVLIILSSNFNDILYLYYTLILKKGRIRVFCQTENIVCAVLI